MLNCEVCGEEIINGNSVLATYQLNWPNGTTRQLVLITHAGCDGYGE